MGSNIENYYRAPCSIYMCQKCPILDLSKAITIEGDTVLHPYTFSIEPFEPREQIMLMCEGKEYTWSGKGTCAITIMGDTNDIINLIKNIHIEVK